VDYRILSFDAGMKYKGFFLQTEIYNRWLDNFKADGTLPAGSIHDTGFYIQAAFYPVPKKLEVYGATSQIYGDKKAGFSNSSEYLVGMNYYPFKTRNHRLNVQVDENRSPVSSAFGYYVGGLNGTSFATAFSVFFWKRRSSNMTTHFRSRRMWLSLAGVTILAALAALAVSLGGRFSAAPQATAAQAPAYAVHDAHLHLAS
jgi:hypothetical protein